MQYKKYPNKLSNLDISIQIDETRVELLPDVSKTTLYDRYLSPNETPQERFAAVSAWYGDDQSHAQRMYNYISKHWLMPSTPILGNGGTERGLPISCFLNNVDDTLESIIGSFTETSWMSALGGGTGTCWSDVRSVGETINRVGVSGGVIPFICNADANVVAISQGSLRRGSNAAYLHVSHPEIEEFIHVRKVTGGDPSRKALNISNAVVIPDSFMNAVTEKLDWDLISPATGEVIKTVSAVTLWRQILLARVALGMPYILFIDSVNRNKPDIYKKLGLDINQSNLCSEITLTTGKDHLGNMRSGVCDLLSLNLEYLDDWFGNKQFVKDAMLFLDNTLDDFIDKTEDNSAFKNARYSAMRERSIGIGTMGLHSYLQSESISLESNTALQKVEEIYSWLHEITTVLNKEISEEKSPCPDALDAGIMKRFTHVTSIAPTASISIIAGCSSPSIDPYISNAYTQKTLSGSFGVKNKHLDKLLRSKYNKTTTTLDKEEWLNEIWSSIVTNEGSVQNITFLSTEEKNVFKTAFEIDNTHLINMAKIYTPYIDQSTSLNLFLKPDISKKFLHAIHMKAWEFGIKSLYYLRSQSLRRAEVVTHVSGILPSEAYRYGESHRATCDIQEGECLSCQ